MSDIHQPKLQIDLRTWSSILSRARQGTINDTSVFKQYQPFSNETYGELNPNFIEDIIKNAEISPRDVFLDVGSGIGNVAIQVASQVGCTSIGVEIRQELHEIALKMLEQARLTLSKLSYPVKMGEVKLICGDFLEKVESEIDLSGVTVMLVNNYCFSSALSQTVLELFRTKLAPGTRVVATRDFCPRFRTESRRLRDHPCHMFEFPWITYTSPEDSVSWDCKGIPYFKYIVKPPQHRGYKSPKRRTMAPKALLTSISSNNRARKDPLLEKAISRKRLYNEFDDKENNPRNGRVRRETSIIATLGINNSVEEIAYWWD